MIRSDDGHSAFEDLWTFFVRRRARILDWLYEASRIAATVELSQAAIDLLERKTRRSLSPEARLAMGWIVAVLVDIEEQLRRAEAASRSPGQVAYDNAVAAARTDAVRRFTGLHPHAAAQLSMVLGEVERHHL